MKEAEPNFAWRKLAEFNLPGQSQNGGSGLHETPFQHAIQAVNLETVIDAIGAALPNVSGKSLEQLHAVLFEHIDSIWGPCVGMAPIQVHILVDENIQVDKPGWAFFLIEKGPGQPPASHAVDIYLYSEGKEND